MAEEENMKDALRDNIDRKGKYSYYYGHANQDAIMRESGSAIKTMGGRVRFSRAIFSSFIPVYTSFDVYTGLTFTHTQALFSHSIHHSLPLSPNFFTVPP